MGESAVAAEVFYCTEYHCRMSKKECATRYTAARKDKKGRDAQAYTEWIGRQLMEALTP